MSANARPEQRAFDELEKLVHHLGEELASFRRRALAAEAQLRDSAQHAGGRAKAPPPERTAELESENAELRARVERAEDRVRQMMDRLRFLRQQIQTQAGAGAAR